MIYKEAISIVKLFLDIDRYTVKKNIPVGFRQLKKEIFTNDKYVIKFTNFKKNKGIDNYVYENEAEYLKKLQNFKFIPRFYGKYEENKNIYLVMEYLNGSSMDNLTFSEWFQIKKNIDLLEEKLKYILNKFAENNIIHRDLRPHNIVIIKSSIGFDVKVIDFQYMMELNKTTHIPKDSQIHYSKVMNNIGSIWRNKTLPLNSFENDEYAINKIIDDLKSKSLLSFIIDKIRGI